MSQAKRYIQMNNQATCSDFVRQHLRPVTEISLKMSRDHCCLSSVRLTSNPQTVCKKFLFARANAGRRSQTAACGVSPHPFWCPLPLLEETLLLITPSAVKSGIAAFANSSGRYKERVVLRVLQGVQAGRAWFRFKS
jgi:hypothetical protein